MGNLYLSSSQNPADSLWLLDETTGNGSQIGSGIGFGNVYGLNFLNDILYGFTEAGETISIDTTTGAGIFIANNSLASFGADGAGGVTPPNISEPATIFAFSAGLLGIAVWRRKRKR